VLALALDALVVLAALVWAGGLLVLGAIVAPTVFGSGDPHAADVMTAIFSRFDRVAVVCAALVLVGEAASLAVGRPMHTSARVTRIALALALAVLAGVQAGYLTPTIAALHEQGVVRGVGALGARFDRIHHASETVGKLTVLAAMAFAVSVFDSRRRTARDADERESAT
jgi:hypothetical protein